jgi:hypothetical protein
MANGSMSHAASDRRNSPRPARPTILPAPWQSGHRIHVCVRESAYGRADRRPGRKRANLPCGPGRLHEAASALAAPRRAFGLLFAARACRRWLAAHLAGRFDTLDFSSRDWLEDTWSPDSGEPTAGVRRRGPAGSAEPSVGTVHEIVTCVDPGPTAMAHRIAERRRAAWVRTAGARQAHPEVWQAGHPQLDIWISDFSGKQGPRGWPSTT